MSCHLDVIPTGVIPSVVLFFCLQVMYAADWFLTLFARTMPQHFVCRVFDVVFGKRAHTGRVVTYLAVLIRFVSSVRALGARHRESMGLVLPSSGSPLHLLVFISLPFVWSCFGSS